MTSKPSLWEMIQDSFAFLFTYWKWVFLLILISQPLLFYQSLTETQETLNDPPPLRVVLMIFTAIVDLYVLGAITHATHQDLRGSFDPKRSLIHTLRRLPLIVFITFVYILMVVLGLTIFILPGIYLFYIHYFASTIAVLDPKLEESPFKQSRKLIAQKSLPMIKVILFFSFPLSIIGLTSVYALPTGFTIARDVVLCFFSFFLASLNGGPL